jgi:hypothetical protein
MTVPSSNLPELLRSLGDAEAPPEDATAEAARRRRVVHKIEGALRAVASDRARAERRRKIGVGAAAAAAVVLILGAATRLRHRDPVAGAAPSVAHLREVAGAITVADGRGVPRSLDAERALRAGDTVTTAADAHAHVVLESGISVEAASATAISLGEPFDPAIGQVNEEIRLGQGQVFVQVPKRPAGASFRVRTLDVEVVVHGTSFVVQVCDGCGGASGSTAVKVSEGVVAVRQGGKETLVTAGEQWPTRSPEEGKASPLRAPGERGAPSESAAAAIAPPAKSASAKAAESTLAQQNRIYQGALEARRRGDHGRAIGLLDDLLSRYPKSPLAQEARVERLRCLERLGRHGAAAAEARRYLADYPDGFARDEAKARALAPAASTAPKP